MVNTFEIMHKQAEADMPFVHVYKKHPCDPTFGGDTGEWRLPR